MGNAKLVLNGAEYELPVFEGTESETAVDIGKLRGESKAITFDPGYGNTGSCKSAITFINGEKGILRHRGYTIEDLAAKASFTEVSQLLMSGELPTADENAAFNKTLADNGTAHDTVNNVVDQFPADGCHPMAPFAAGIAAMSGAYAEWNDFDAADLNIARLLAQGPTIAARYHRKTIGQTPIDPDPNLSYCGNFLRMMFGDDAVTDVLESALNMLLIVHADHEQNCSTSTVRMVGSSEANVFASAAAGICALWGPRHGGANQAVIEMLEGIKAGGGDSKQHMEKVKDKSSGVRLMGFGHRVYKNFDPRANILKAACDQVLSSLGVDDPLLELAQELEEVALNDDYFKSRNLYPNVDFYSGIIYRAMGIPVDFFTVMFAIGRMPGWLAHWNEMREAGDRIHRPRQIYTGATAREFPS